MQFLYAQKFFVIFEKFYICIAEHNKMEYDTLYILVNFGYILIFGLLTIAVTMLHMPKKEKGMENYRKSRHILGIATGLMSVYCLYRILFPEHRGDYQDFWFLMIFVMVFSWLSFSSFLFLIDTPRYQIRHFITDGLIPIVLIVLTGIIGLIFPSSQKTIMIIFGCGYGIKCTYMLHTCLKEYRKCRKEVDNYYDEGPDTRWMYIMLILASVTYLGVIALFYVNSLGIILYPLVPVTYTYVIFKVIGFSTKKIDNIRKKNILLEVKPKEEKQEKAKDISGKVGPLVEEWVAEKKFCREGLNIKDVAMEMGTNQSYLSQYLNNYLEQSFSVWLNTLRIEESKTLLASSDKISIEEIGIKVGIPQNYNFSRWFKTVTDMTPFQYRRSILNGKK